MKKPHKPTTNPKVEEVTICNISGIKKHKYYLLRQEDSQLAWTSVSSFSWVQYKQLIFLFFIKKKNNTTANQPNKKPQQTNQPNTHLIGPFYKQGQDPNM